MATKRRFVKGDVYVIEFDDHYGSDRSSESGEDAKPVRLRAIGAFAKESDTTVVLESERHMTDTSVDQRTKRVGIIKSCIRSVKCLGPA